MMRPLIPSLAFATVLITGTAPAWSADRAVMEGEQLFSYHGCVNCHGASGSDPTSKLVPKIGGLEAGEIMEKSRKILKGETTSEEAKLMKSAIAYSQSCDAPPTDAELQKIATWLATQ
ncbi:MAG: c-type cytochrome [Sphingobacteriia bacterium]|nr:c-type cytochrome [Sphingobacteriia bacterium]NCC39756.1 c-type cytochrome [Gammaproteobacteria bacterium]